MSGFIIYPPEPPEPGMVRKRTLFPITNKLVVASINQNSETSTLSSLPLLTHEAEEESLLPLEKDDDKEIIS